MEKEKFSVRERLKSFTYAFNGLKILFGNEHNARIHLVIAVCAILLGVLLHISFAEWLFIILAIGLVFAMEAINSSIEYLADHVTTDYHRQIKKVKDLSAAAVLLVALAALATGLVIFLPKLIALW